MSSYTIITTEVTSFNDRHCVAGWDVDRKIMVRPEPPATTSASIGTRFWLPEYAGPGKVFDVGSRVTFEATKAPPSFPYPHATEDVILVPDSNITSQKRMSLKDTAAAVAGSVSASIQEAYDNGVCVTSSGLLYVPNGHKGRSLGALEITGGLRFWEKGYYDKPLKLRAWVALEGNEYDIPITSSAMIGMWRERGLDAVQASADKSARIHLRLGLSRPFQARPDECFVQINDLYFL